MRAVIVLHFRSDSLNSPMARRELVVDPLDGIGLGGLAGAGQSLKSSKRVKAVAMTVWNELHLRLARLPLAVPLAKTPLASQVFPMMPSSFVCAGWFGR